MPVAEMKQGPLEAALPGRTRTPVPLAVGSSGLGVPSLWAERDTLAIPAGLSAPSSSVVQTGSGGSRWGDLQTPEARTRQQQAGELAPRTRSPGLPLWDPAVPVGSLLSGHPLLPPAPGGPACAPAVL